MTAQIAENICIETISIDDKTLVTINLKEATFQHADEFKSCVEELVKLGNNKLVLDFSNCAFIDSTFLGTIAIILKSLRGKNGDLKIVYSGNFARTIMTSNGIDRAIDLYESVDEAIDSFS